MAVGTQTPVDLATEFQTFAYLIQEKIQQIQTLTLCRVVDCTNDGGIVPVGTVTLQPLVNLMSGDRVAFQHKQLYKVPYCRVQGGTNAVIIDPKPGDLGVAGFCSRDISAVKAAQDIANPGSFRTFAMSDGVYLFTCLGGEVPTQYVLMTDEGVTVKSPNTVTIEAPTINLKGNVTHTDGNYNNPAGTVTANGIGLTTHKHPTAPAGPVSQPIP